MIQVVAKMGYVGSGKCSSLQNNAVLFKIIKSYHSIKLTWSDLFRLYYTKKNNWRRGEANGQISERNDW